MFSGNIECHRFGKKRQRQQASHQKLFPIYKNSNWRTMRRPMKPPRQTEKNYAIRNSNSTPVQQHIVTKFVTVVEIERTKRQQELKNMRNKRLRHDTGNNNE